MVPSNDLRLESPGHQSGQTNQEDNQGETAVRQEQVGRALQFQHSHRYRY